MKFKFLISILFFLSANIFLYSEDSPELVMQNLLSLFKSYERVETGQKLTQEQIDKNKITAAKIEAIFSYNSMITGALADQWKNMSKKQQNDFYNKFKSLIELVAYPQGSYFYNNSKNTFKETILKNNIAIVPSDNYNIDKDRDVSLKYIFQKINGNWMLVDVEMNGHSLVEEYKMMINRLVSKSGLNGLMDTMNKKYDELTK